MAFNLPKGKPKNGNLIRVYPSGQVYALASNKPFPELQLLKKKYRMMGIPEVQLKVTNLKPDQK